MTGHASHITIRCMGHHHRSQERDAWDETINRCTIAKASHTIAKFKTTANVLPDTATQGCLPASQVMVSCKDNLALDVQEAMHRKAYDNCDVDERGCRRLILFTATASRWACDVCQSTHVLTCWHMVRDSPASAMHSPLICLQLLHYTYAAAVLLHPFVVCHSMRVN